MDESYFPRGGAEKQVKKQRVKEQAQDEDLFKSNEVPKGKKRKAETAETKQKKKAKLSGKPQKMAPLGGNMAPLTYWMVNPGMLLLGCVKSIQDYSIELGFTNGLRGTVSITSVSDAYHDQLQTLASQEEHMDTEDLDIHSLHELFKVGMIIPCKVLKVTDSKGGKKSLTVTINPREINQQITVGNIRNGLALYGSISSKEDHGYIVDIGVSGLRAFLKTADAERFIQLHNDGYSLRVGQPVLCMVETEGDRMDRLIGNNRAINVTIDPKKIEGAFVDDSMKINMNNLLPGMKLKVKAKMSSPEGATAYFLKLSGVIPATHLSHKVAKLTELDAVVLSVNPFTKAVSLSCLPHLVGYKGVPWEDQFSGLRRGVIIEGALVTSAQNDGVFLKLNEKVQGYADVKNLSDQRVQNVKPQFKEGTKLRCRVMDFNLVENIVIVTMKQSILNRQFLVTDDIKPGMVLECFMKKFTDSGIKVKITDHIFGLIPMIHIADIPLEHPEKKFEADKKLKCLVLKVDSEKRQVILSNKNSLRTSKYPVITSFDQLQSEMIVEGFIASVTQNGCLVVFCNNVKGWVPTRELSTERINFPEKVFYVGQVVRCRVLSVEPDKQKLILSFKISSISTSFGTKKAKLPEDFKVGELADCKIKKRVAEGFDVELIPSKLPAYLPKCYLSDSLEICDLLHDVLTVNTVLKNVVYISGKSVITVSNKSSVRDLAMEDQLPTQFDEFQLGVMVPGSVKGIVDFGIFVELAGPHVGLVPSRYAADKHVPNLHSIYTPGQSVVVKVTDRDVDKGRFVGSLKMEDCYHGDTDIGLNLLRQYLKDVQTIHDEISSQKGDKSMLGSLQVGQIKTITVTNVTPQGVLCELPGGVRGVVEADNTKDVDESALKVGNNLKGIILNIDFKENCVELSLSPKLIKDVQKRRKHKFAEVKQGQLLRCDVVLVKTEFILIMLRGHARGALAYLPAKRHLNDVLEVHQFTIGQDHPVIVKEVDGETVLCSMQVHEKRKEKELEGEQEYKIEEPHELKPGIVCSALVRMVLPLQLNVFVNKVAGRVHITEMVDEIQNGDNPISGYEEGKQIRVKIVGFREAKSHKYLPITHKKLKKALPECSIKPSKLKEKGLKAADVTGTATHKVGDKVIGFIKSYENHVAQVILSPSTTGWVYFLNLTDNLKLLKEPEKHFLSGQGYNATVVAVNDTGSVELSFTGKKETVKEGGVCKGWIKGFTKRKSVKFHLPDGYKGEAEVTDLNDKFSNSPLSGYKTGQVVNCYTYKVDKEEKTCKVSLRVSKTTRDTSKLAVEDPDVRSLHDLSKNQVLRGYVMNVDSHTCPAEISVSIGHKISGTAKYPHISDYKCKELHKYFWIGKVVTAKILDIEFDTGKVSVTLRGSDTGTEDPIPSILDLPLVPSKAKKHKLKDSSGSPTAGKKPKTGNNTTTPSSGKKKTKGLQDDSDSDSGVDVYDKQMTSTQRLQVSAGFSWDADLTTIAKPSERESSDEESDDSEEEEEKPKKVKKSKAEIRLEKQAEEKRLFELEQSKLSGDILPQSVDEFDQMVVSSPDSSLVWLQYMAFHLQSAEIDKARAVAERALKTISFREEQEKLNVYVAYLNLENLYGSPEQLEKVLERAVKQNDATKVYRQMINIYVKSGKMEEAESLFNLLTKKRKHDKETWIGFGLFFYKDGRLEDARKIMQRSFHSLDKKHHVEVIAKFGQMEYKYGEPERGNSLFENVVKNYPKRSDLWSVYIDMVTKTGDVRQARKLFERAINLKHSAKKMKFFFKKYMDFEKSYGDEDTVQTVKQKALKYVERVS